MYVQCRIQKHGGGIRTAWTKDGKYYDDVGRELKGDYTFICKGFPVVTTDKLPQPQ